MLKTLYALIREEIVDRQFTQNKELIDLAKDAIVQLKSKGENYYELQALVNALDYSLVNGVVLAKGNPFYGETTGEIASKIQRNLDIFRADGIIEVIPEFEPDEDEAESFIQGVREVISRYRGRVPKSFGIEELMNLVDDYETSVRIGEEQRAKRFRVELEMRYSQIKGKLGL